MYEEISAPVIKPLIVSGVDGTIEPRKQQGGGVQGSDWRHIIHHEFGHVLANVFKIDSLEITYGILGEDVILDEIMDFIEESLSEYAAAFLDGSEIISEVSSDIATQNPSEFSQRFYAKVCELIKGGAWI